MQHARFVTGFPSLLARTVVSTLLEAGEDPVIVLVRRADLPVAEAFAARLSVEERARFEVVEGDPTAIDLGLSGPSYAPFSNRLSTIYHAHEAPFGTPARDAVREQLGGAREAIALAKAADKAPVLVFFSTALVAGDRKGTMPEEELDARRDFGTPVIEARARAEKMVRAVASTVPTVVLRPTLLTGHSVTGELAPLTPFAELLAALVEARRRPDALGARTGSDRRLHVVPVDWVAKVAVALAGAPPAYGRTVHVADDRPLSYDHLVDLVARATARATGGTAAAGFGAEVRAPKPRMLLPRNLKEAFFTTPGFERFAENPKLFGWWLSGPTSYSRANLVRFYTDGPSCPAFESYVERLILVSEEARRSMMPPPRREEPIEIEDPLA